MVPELIKICKYIFKNKNKVHTEIERAAFTMIKLRVEKMDQVYF